MPKRKYDSISTSKIQAQNIEQKITTHKTMGK